MINLSDFLKVLHKYVGICRLYWEIQTKIFTKRSGYDKL